MQIGEGLRLFYSAPAGGGTKGPKGTEERRRDAKDGPAESQSRRGR